MRQLLRALARNPGYSLTAVAVLALGIGANVAIFSAVYAVILSPLPFPASDRLVAVWEHHPGFGMGEPLLGRIQASHNNYVEWQRQNRSFSQMGAFRTLDLIETSGTEPKHIDTGFGSAGLFDLLGAEAQLGRLFGASEESPGADHVVVLTDEYFQTRFARDPNALGQQLIIDNANYTVVGVLPPGFRLPAFWQGEDQQHPDVWVPLSRLWGDPGADINRQLIVVARLKDGVTLEQARSDMERVGSMTAEADPANNEDWTTLVFPLSVEDTASRIHAALYTLFAAVGFLLLIACANLASLTLARSASRAREVAVRLAMGASRTRIVVWLMSESLAVSLAGTAAGLLLAHWAIAGMIALQPAELQRPESIRLSLPVFAFAGAVAILTALGFGLAPAISASRMGLHSTLKAVGGRGGSAARSFSRRALIAMEIALALMLFSGAGLMIRSFRQIMATGIGFDITNLTSIDFDLPEVRYPDAESYSRFHRRLLDQLRDAPGIEQAAVIDNLPLHRVAFSSFTIAGHPLPEGAATPFADFASISPGYFDAVGMELRAGRRFTPADLSRNELDGDGVVAVNEAFAAKYLPGENPIGQRLVSATGKQFEIVGVVSDTRPAGVENGLRPETYWPYLKVPHVSLVVRTQAEPTQFRKVIEQAVWAVDPELPVNLVSLDEHLDSWNSQRKFNTLLMGIFAALALVLAAIGIFGLLSNLISARTREIGIRMAVGATPAGIVRMVLSDSMRPVLIGIVLGLAGTLALGRLVESLLFGVSSHDPLSLAAATIALLLAAPLAALAPLYRATRIDCTVALREE